MKCLKLISSICVMMLCQVPSILLTQSDGKLVLRRSFPELPPHPGATVRFSCNISMVQYNYAELRMNWYKTCYSSKSDMIVQFSPQNTSVTDARFEIRWNRTTGIAELSIRDLWYNDSGSYCCMLIDVTSRGISTSNLLNLTVTEKIEEPSTVTPEVVPPHTSNITVPVSVTSASIAVLLLLLLGYVLFLLIRKTEERKKPQSDSKHLDKEPQALPVYTVDYGVLEFQTDGSTKMPPQVPSPDNVEYATIIFPEPEPANKKKRRQKPV
ncbi:programmed cell death protein 1 [Microcaecilia unicolor]|uniref:Programmed cell death protein 1 n=1 Tax=Microcaecilia unicolor TaxID=1415580 RepID=A0A6P7ZA13_9AMPH|nr:programmed cell death protein 1 [Microcaecilia unicolor]